MKLCRCRSKSKSRVKPSVSMIKMPITHQAKEFGSVQKYHVSQMKRARYYRSKAMKVIMRLRFSLAKKVEFSPIRSLRVLICTTR